MEDKEPVIDNSRFLVKLTLLKWLKTNVALSLKFVFEKFSVRHLPPGYVIGVTSQLRLLLVPFCFRYVSPLSIKASK